MHVPSGETISKLLQASAAVLSAIAWPVVGLSALILLRVPIRAFLTDISEFGWGKAFARKGPPVTQQVQKPEDEAIRALEATATEDTATDAPATPFAVPARLEIPPAARKIREILAAGSERYAPEERSERLLDAAAVMTLNLGFEQAYRLIFGSQLELLRRAAAGPVTFDDARAIYERSPVTKQGAAFPFARWLDFLVQYGEFLEKRQDADVLDITEHGREFLSYLAQNGIEHNRPL
jgi:hypothetical protein